MAIKDTIIVSIEAAKVEYLAVEGHIRASDQWQRKIELESQIATLTDVLNRIRVEEIEDARKRAEIVVRDTEYERDPNIGTNGMLKPVFDITMAQCDSKQDE